MADIQWENGYVKIANQIIEQLSKIRLAGEASQVLFVIFRKTYGWGKKSDFISLNQFSSNTGLTKSSIVRAIRKLQSYKMILTENKNGLIQYTFNKNYEHWKPLPKKIILNTRQSSLKKHCYICNYKETLHHHHIIPINEGGLDRVSNLIPLCPNCLSLVHRGKYSTDFLVIKKDNTENIDKNVNSDLPNCKKAFTKKRNTKETITKETITKETIQKKETFGKFVKLENDEYNKLCELYSKKAIDDFIERINDYLSSTGKKPYKDYAATIRNWIRREGIKTRKEDNDKYRFR